MDGLKARLSFDAVAYDYDDEYLTIDTDTHTININNVSRLFGVQYDGNSKLIKFRIRNKLSDIQKMQDSIVYINWIDSKGVKGQSIAINKTINNDTCEFAWKVPFDALKNSGVLHFAMSAVMTKNSSSVIDQRWSTQIASVITPDGIYIKSYTPSSEEEDRIAQIYNELSKTINKLSDDIEIHEIKMSNIPNTYIDNDDNSITNKYDINIYQKYAYGRYYTNGYKNFTNFVYNENGLKSGNYTFVNNTGFQFSVVRYVSDTEGSVVLAWRINDANNVIIDDKVYINFAKLDNSDFTQNDINNIRINFKIISKNETITLPDIERSDAYFNPKFYDYDFISLFNVPHTFVTKTGVSNKDTKKLFQTNKFCYKFSSKSSIKQNNEFRLNITNPFNLLGIQEFIMVLYLPSEKYIKSITLMIEKENNGIAWSRNCTSFKHGWNYLHFYSCEGNIDTWNTTKLIRVLCSYNDSDPISDVYVCDIIAVKPSKAKLIFVEDHGYSTFYKSAYPRLKQLNIPVTWGINPGILGTVAGETTKLTQLEIDEMSNDPYCEFSFHSWDTSATKNMTSDDINNDVQKCITYLRKNGILPQYFWRCAWVQNQALNANASKYILPCYATPSSNAGFINYPFVNKYNVARTQLHGKSDFTNMFDTLKKTHCAIVVYTHDLSEAGGIHIKENEFSAFLSAVKGAINEGWLDPTTYNRLCVKYGENEQLLID